MALWVRLLPEMFPEAEAPRQAGPIAAAIYGSLGAMARIRPAIPDTSTTFGSSILPPWNGPGWVEATRYPPAQAAGPECTALWAHLPREICREPDPRPSAG